jgi:biopolymer transport protein TolQ
MEETLWNLVQRTLSTSGTIEKATVYLLILLSIVSWAVILEKSVEFYLARRNGNRFLTLMDKADSFGAITAAEPYLGASPFLAIFTAAVRFLEAKPPAATAGPAAGARGIALRPERAHEELVLMAMQGASLAAFTRLKIGLVLLAVSGSTSPFIGLFGTVWGIMSTFRSLGQAETASLAVVAPGIASALIATAAGLFVAIPAVIAYNWLLAHINRMQDDADLLMDRLMVIIRASEYGAAWKAQAGVKLPEAVPAPAPKPQAEPAPAVPASGGTTR